MTIEELRNRKEKLRLTAEMIAEASGVPVSTVQKIFSGVTKAPRKATVDAISRALLEQDPETAADAKQYRDQYDQPGTQQRSERINYLSDSPENAYPDLVGETAGNYQYEKRENRGGYTLQDYYALPDERRVELIDGVFYDMSAPAIIHQKILGELHILFRECTDTHEGNCEVYLSPCDVRLDRDNRTMVQPDLLVVCREYDIGARAFDGAPDLTLEILSPSTRSKDMLLKLHKYANAGVREYWIVDPDRKTVLVYDLEKEDYYPRTYSFEDTIPIGLSGGKCSIDFSRVMRKIEKYYE